MKDQNIYFFGYLGLLAAIMVGIGEFLVHFSTAPFDETIPYSYMLNVSDFRLTMGHFLMIPFIPLYIFGYWHLYLALKSGDRLLAKAVLTLGIFAFVIGGIWVGSRAHLGMLIKAQAAAGEVAPLFESVVASYSFHIENLVQALRVIILLTSICFVWAILKGGTHYPKWMAFFNPIFLLILVVFLFFCVRLIGQFLMPSAMNVAHFFLFSASLYALKSRQVPAIVE